MKQQSLLFLVLLAVSQFSIAASGSATTASKAAASQYAADKELCAEESTSSARMQCLRDAKAEYTKALAAAKKDQAINTKKDQATASKSNLRTPACSDCGKVLDVSVGEKKGEGGALGIIGGGVAGAVLGHQVGGGTGKNLATIAGAAGGAYAGHKIEEKMKATKVWSVRVRLDSGEERTFAFDHDPGFSAGDSIKVSGDSIIRR